MGIESLLPFLKIHNFIEKSNIKNYNGLVAAVRPVGCIKTFQIATHVRSTETSECEIFSYITDFSFKIKSSGFTE